MDEGEAMVTSKKARGAAKTIRNSGTGISMSMYLQGFVPQMAAHV